MARGFNAQALVADLRSWWDEQVGKDDPFASPKPASGTIMDVLPEVDSLATVTALIVIAHHLPCEAPPSVIRPGGYHGFDDMVQDMLPKLQALVDKHAQQQKDTAHTEEKTA